MESIRKHLVSEHIPIAVGFKIELRSDKFPEECYQDYFGPDDFKQFFEDLLGIETLHSFKNRKEIISIEEVKLYHDRTDICYSCNKQCTGKVNDYYHETFT